MLLKYFIGAFLKWVYDKFKLKQTIKTNFNWSETGVGKTTILQHLSALIGNKFTNLF